MNKEIIIAWRNSQLKMLNVKMLLKGGGGGGGSP